MPIIGLTTNRNARLPVVGRIRKGGQKETKLNKEGKPVEVMGRDLDHFRFVTDEPALAKLWLSSYGQTPREINILFPYPTVEECFDAWREAYNAGSLIHRCDGVISTLWLDPKTNQYRTDPVPCPGYYHAEKNKAGCRPVGRLTVLVREFSRLAHVTVETHSINDIIQIQENLEALFSVRRNLRGIPCVLQRRERQISTPNESTGKRTRRGKWLLFVEADPQWVVHQLAAFERAATPMLPAPEAPQIEAPTDADDAGDDYEEGDYTENDGDYDGGETQHPAAPEPDVPQETLAERQARVLAEVTEEGFDPGYVDTNAIPVVPRTVNVHEAPAVQQATMPMAGAALDLVHLCQDCKKEIRAATINGQSYTSERLASRSADLYGRELCAVCIEKRPKAARPSAATVGGGSR